MTQGEQAPFTVDPGARTEVAPAEGERAGEPGFGADDPEMVELRAFAAEVVRAGGGVPRGSGYRPRLEPQRRALAAAPVELLSAVGWEIGSSLRRRPMRTLAFALAGFGAVAGALFLWWALVARDASLELAAAVPNPTGVAPVPAPPPPPPVTSTPDEPAPAPIAPAPIAADKAPVVPPREAPAAGATSKRGPALDKGSAAPRVARSTTAKRVRAQKEKTALSLDRGAIIEGMQAIQPRVKACYRAHKQRGVANVRIEVGNGGKVKAVTVAGPLARTRTAACVKAAVKTARFRGGGISFQYPLVLP